MKGQVISALKKQTTLTKEEIESLIEVPPNSELGDYSFPCFALSRKLKKNPSEISKELSSKIKSPEFEKVEAVGPYLNFFLNPIKLSDRVLKEISSKKDKYGSSDIGKKKVIVIDMSSPNIAKPFGIGHLRSTIIGNSVANISQFNGYKTVRINYLGDWGTPFGKIIAGYKKFGNSKKLEKDPIKHLYEIYVKASRNSEFEEIGRRWFKKLESGDEEAVSLWKKFRELSLSEFNKIYDLLGVKFDVISGESFYNNKMSSIIKELEKKNLLKESEGARIVDLKKYNLGVVLIQKSDGTTLYATRDITAAIHRRKKYNADFIFYEVGSEQKLHFQQIFKTLELMGYSWAKNLRHIDHGLYLGRDGRKFSTRKGKTIFMADILQETKSLARQELSKRQEKIPKSELEKRSLLIARAAIVYGDLKNHRSQDVVFDIKRFLEFEGNTGPYLLYSYARARSILRKARHKSSIEKTKSVTEKEKELILELSKFPEVVKSAHEQLSPNLIANYAFSLSQKFNEFYQSTKVIGSDEEKFRLSLVDSFSQVLRNSLGLLGIETIERM